MLTMQVFVLHKEYQGYKEFSSEIISVHENIENATIARNDLFNESLAENTDTRGPELETKKGSRGNKNWVQHNDGDNYYIFTIVEMVLED